MSRAVQGRYARRSARNVKRVPRNRPKPNYGLLFGCFVMAAMVSGLASFALQTPMLLVKEIRISGVSLADKAAVEKAAKAALGRNIILLRKGGIQSGIAGLPEVRSVTVGRTLPDKVWVRVRERRPDAVVVAGSNGCMVQFNGFGFHSVPGPVGGVPTVEVAGSKPVGEGSVCSAPGVRNALTALACARRERLPVAKISVDPVGDMCLNMEGGFYVKLGQPDEIARKMSILRSTLVCRPSIGREAVYIDLSCPSAPVWKPKSESGEAS